MDKEGSSRREYFLIDVVSFALLDEFLAALEVEVKYAKAVLDN